MKIIKRAMLMANKATRKMWIIQAAACIRRGREGGGWMGVSKVRRDTNTRGLASSQKLNKAANCKLIMPHLCTFCITVPAGLACTSTVHLLCCIGKPRNLATKWRKKIFMERIHLYRQDGHQSCDLLASYTVPISIPTPKWNWNGNRDWVQC